MKLLSFLLKENNAAQHVSESDGKLFEEKYAEFYKEGRAYVTRNFDSIARAYAEERLDRFFDHSDKAWWKVQEAREQAKIAETGCKDARHPGEEIEDRRARTEAFLAKMAKAKEITREVGNHTPIQLDPREPDIEPG